MKSYIEWVTRFLCFHAPVKPDKLSTTHIHQFVSNLTLEKNASLSTQKVAMSALASYFRKCLIRDPGDFSDFTKARKGTREPTVLNRNEISAVFAATEGTHLGLILQLLYGTGMRLMECLNLIIGDLDFDQSYIMVRNGKGKKDRLTPLPKELRGRLGEQIQFVEALHRSDLLEGFGEAALPETVA